MEVEPSPPEDLLAPLAPSHGAEDFITEAFCWLLSWTGFGDSFLRRLTQYVQGGLPTNRSTMQLGDPAVLRTRWRLEAAGT